MKFLVVLFSLVLSTSTFASEEELSLFCTSPDTSAELLIRMDFEENADSTLGRYVFQAAPDSLNVLSSFASEKRPDGIFIVADNESFLILTKKASNSEWVAVVTLRPAGVELTLYCN